MRYWPIFLLLLQGCSTLGELEVLNDVGLGEAREVISTYNKSMNVLGIQSNTPNASTANRAYGHLQNMSVDIEQANDVPFVIRDINEIFRYLP